MVLDALTSALLLLPRLPGQGSRPPPSDTSPRYIELLELNSQYLYPLLAVAALALLVVGILQAWRTREIDGKAKAEFKREIITELRKNVAGCSAESLSRTVGLERLKLVKLLEEMQEEGAITSHTNTQRLQVWRLRGIGPGAA